MKINEVIKQATDYAKKMPWKDIKENVAKGAQNVFDFASKNVKELGQKMKEYKENVDKIKTDSIGKISLRMESLEENVLNQAQMIQELAKHIKTLTTVNEDLTVRLNVFIWMAASALIVAFFLAIKLFLLK